VAGVIGGAAAVGGSLTLRVANGAINISGD